MQKLSPKSPYARNVIILMSGSGLAQVITLAVSPILTRLYSPEDFGVYALYVAIASIMTVLVTGRYELAILLPKDNRNALNVVALSMILSCIISTLLLLLILIFHSSITEFLDAPELAEWLYWIPASTLLMGCYTSLSYWSNRKAYYQRLAISRVVQTGSTSFMQLGVKNANVGAGGLIIGSLAGQFLAGAVLAHLIYLEEQKKIKALRWKRMLKMAHTYRNFPRFLIVAHGLNTVSGQIPLLLLSSLFNTATAGFYILIQRVMGAPMLLVAGAIGDVFRQEASQAYINVGSCRDIYIKTFKRLLILSVLPFMIFFLLAPTFFGWFFGESWRVAGEYAQILTPMFFLQFTISPISQVTFFAEKQKIDLAWQICFIALVLLAFLFGYLMEDVRLLFTFFSGACCLMYVLGFMINYRLTCRAKNLD